MVQTIMADTSAPFAAPSPSGGRRGGLVWTIFRRNLAGIRSGDTTDHR
jgi:hypothetical protein